MTTIERPSSFSTSCLALSSREPPAELLVEFVDTGGEPPSVPVWSGEFGRGRSIVAVKQILVDAAGDDTVFARSVVEVVVTAFLGPSVGGSGVSVHASGRFPILLRPVVGFHDVVDGRFGPLIRLVYIE